MDDTKNESEASAASTLSVSEQRQFAYSMLHQTHDHLRQDRIALTRKLLAAARAILEEFGGVRQAEGVWLLTAEAHLPLKKSDHQAALTIFREALTLSQTDLGNDHYATGVCHVNVAESLLNLGELVEAEDHYSAAMDILVDALQENQDDMLTKYLADTIAEAEKGFEQLRRTEDTK